MPTQARAKTAAEIFGIPSEARNTRDRLIDRAIDLFYTHGFNAVGLDRIIEEVGVTKTTFYKHFESNDDLMVQAVRKRDAWEMEALKRAVQRVSGIDPRAQLLGVFDVLHEWFNAPDFKGCIFINTASEFPNPNDPIHQAAADHKRKSRTWFRDLARQAGAQDAETFADLYTILVEGTLVLRQVHDRNDAATISRRAADALLEQYIAVGKDRTLVSKHRKAVLGSRSDKLH
jgi:AcrR family transcriptional regulator